VNGVSVCLSASGSELRPGVTNAALTGCACLVQVSAIGSHEDRYIDIKLSSLFSVEISDCSRQPDLCAAKTRLQKLGIKPATEQKTQLSQGKG